MKMKKKFCPKCGAPIHANDKVCAHCGYNLQQYFHTHLPVVRKKSSVQKSQHKSQHHFSRHWLGWLTGILVILFIALGGYVADHRDEIGTTPAQTLSTELPHYSWVATAKKDEGGMNDTLLFLFNGRKITVNPAVPPILKICSELSHDTQARDRINEGVQRSQAHYTVSHDSIKINGRRSIRDIKASNHHYEFTIRTKAGQEVKMIMKPYKKISPRLKN